VKHDPARSTKIAAKPSKWLQTSPGLLSGHKRVATGLGPTLVGFRSGAVKPSPAHPRQQAAYGHTPPKPPKPTQTFQTTQKQPYPPPISSYNSETSRDHAVLSEPLKFAERLGLLKESG
jgi:hypothetical protein